MDTYEIEKCASVQEVFDAVVEIAEGFERIIDSQGDVEVVKSVLKKVIWALEHLRNCALANERLECELSDLKIKISHLEYDKEEKAKLRKKFDEELEQIEEYWKKESKKLNTQIGKLQQEIQRLQKHHKEESEYVEPENENMADEAILTLKETVDNQRNQLHAKDLEIYAKTSEIDALEKQLSRTREVSEKLRHELTLLKRDTQRLLEEKLELQGNVQDHERQLRLLENAMHEMLDTANDTGENDQGIEENISTLQISRLTPAQLKRILCEMKDAKLRLKYLEEEVSIYRERRPSLLVETDLAMRLEAKTHQHSETSPTPEQSTSQRSSFSDQGSNQGSTSDDDTSENSDKELSLEAEWVKKSDVPSRYLVDQQIRDRNLMARRPSAVSKFFARIFSPLSVREEQPMPLAYFATRRSSAGII